MGVSFCGAKNGVCGGVLGVGGVICWVVVFIRSGGRFLRVCGCRSLWVSVSVCLSVVVWWSVWVCWWWCGCLCLLVSLGGLWVVFWVVVSWWVVHQITNKKTCHTKMASLLTIAYPL